MEWFIKNILLGENGEKLAQNIMTEDWLNFIHTVRVFSGIAILLSLFLLFASFCFKKQFVQKWCVILVIIVACILFVLTYI